MSRRAAAVRAGGGGCFAFKAMIGQKRCVAMRILPRPFGGSPRASGRKRLAFRVPAGAWPSPSRVLAAAPYVLSARLRLRRACQCRTMEDSRFPAAVVAWAVVLAYHTHHG